MSVAAPAFLGVFLVGVVVNIASAQGQPARGRSCPPGYTAVVGACSPPGIAQPGAAGTPIEDFESTSTPWGENLINRWVPSDGDPWSAPSEVGTPWPSGGGMWEVRTPFGRGFRFVATSEMGVQSGGKKSEIADVRSLVQGAGHTETWSGLVMFPKKGNPTGFTRNYPDWNTFFDFHSNSGVPLEMGVDTRDEPRRRHIYLKSHPYGGQPRSATARSRLVFDRWYSWRIQLRWSTGSDGFVKWWLNGVLLADWKGPTLGEAEVPYLQFGFYATDRLRNEVWHARMRKS